MSSCFGQYLKLSLFGQSHGEAIGITLDGFPAGMEINMEALQAEMARRAPGQSKLTTPRKEKDEPEFLSGVFQGRTTGQPLTAIIRNTNQRSKDYGDAVDLVRPSHGDYSGHIRYFGFEDFRGGGHFSARLTAPLVLAGALCKQYLSAQGVEIFCHVSKVGQVKDDSFADHPGFDGEKLRAMHLPVLNEEAGKQMEQEILAVREEEDSIGGQLECMVTGLPAGLGAPFFDSVESVISHLMFSVPAVKAIEFGDGIDFSELKGSEANDPFHVTEAGTICAETNHSGGINGGITNGMPVLFKLTIRATPSIGKQQHTVSLRSMKDAELKIVGRHDPCVLPRAVPVVEAVCAIGLMELWKERASCLR